MRKINKIKEIQSIELEILKAFAKYMNLKDVKYSLAAGTMLGAVRHQGFIPWDDDIDIFMVRQEYDKLIDCLRKEDIIIDGHYKFLLPKSSNYIYPFIKLVDMRTVLIEKNLKDIYKIGIWIDIFPLDYCYDDMKKNKKLIDDRRKINLNIMRMATKKGENFFRSVLKKIYNIKMLIVGKNIDYWIKKSNEFPVETGKKYIGSIAWPVTYNDIYPASYFMDYTKIQFEKEEFLVFKDYKKILKYRYGDYMTLPPKDQQHVHDFEAYKY